MPLDQLLWECFRHFVHLDESNAAVHCSLVRYSPITFRLAEALDSVYGNGTDVRGFLDPSNERLLDDVLRHRGQYAEDVGRADVSSMQDETK